MQIERLSVTGTEVLAVQGQLDATTAPQLEGALEDAANYGGGQSLVVDLAGVGLISSAALRVLLSAAKRARRENGKIHLCAANAEVRKVFEISGLAALFDLHDTREEALAATVGGSAQVEPPTAVDVPVHSFAPARPEAAMAPEPPPAPFSTPPPPSPPPIPPVPIAPPPAPAPMFQAPPANVAPPSPPAPMPPPPHAPAPPAFPPVPPAPAASAFATVPPVPAAPPLPGPFPAAAPASGAETISPAAPTAPAPSSPIPPPARARAIAPPPTPAPARVAVRPAAPTGGASTAAPGGGGGRRPFPVFPLVAGFLGLGLVLAAAAYFLFNRLAPKTGLAEVTPAPTVSPADSPTPAPGPSIEPLDSPTPAPTVAATPTPDSGLPTPTPTPALVAPANGASPSVSPAPGSPNNVGDAGEANRVAAPSQVNFDPSDPRNAAVREAVLRRIESMPVSRKVKDQLYAALERARGMGKVATITFGAGRTDLSAGDVEGLRKGLAQPITARLKADPTVVIVVLGYADTKGDAAANRKLSEQRAARTIDALKGPCGLSNIMHSVGMGASELLDGKNSEANRAVEVWAVQP